MAPVFSLMIDRETPTLEWPSRMSLEETQKKFEETQKEAKEKFDEIANKVKSAVGSKTEEPKKEPPDASVTSSVAATASSKDAKAESKKQREDDLKRKIELEDAEKKKANSALERQLDDLLSRAEAALKAAADASKAHVAAINEHAKLLRKAVEDPNISDKDPQWAAVTEAQNSVGFAGKVTSAKESAAKTELSRLNERISEAVADVHVKDNPVLLRAKQKVNTINKNLQDARLELETAIREGRIMNEFRQLVNEGREQFSKELKSILPSVDVKSKGAKMTEDDLNALIAHAHLRVDQLRKQLAEQHIREQQRIGEALDAARAERRVEQDERLAVEVEAAARRAAVEWEKKLLEAKEEWEADLRRQMRRQAAAHSEHLEEVLKVQREQHESDTHLAVDEARREEKQHYFAEVSDSLAKVKGIETALDNRAEQDRMNRQAKDLWLACQEMRHAILVGRAEGRDADARRKPLANNVMHIAEHAAQNDKLVSTLIKSMPDAALKDGVYSEEDLLSRFRKVDKVCRRVAMIGENGGTLGQYALSAVQSLLVIRPWRPLKIDPREQIDVEGIDTFEVLDKTRGLLHAGDYLNALRVMLLLRGEPRRVADSWIHDLRTHLEAKQIADVLLAHASVTSVSTIY